MFSHARARLWVGCPAEFGVLAGPALAWWDRRGFICRPVITGKPVQVGCRPPESDHDRRASGTREGFCQQAAALDLNDRRRRLLYYRNTT